jgi:hypothetical protein
LLAGPQKNQQENEGVLNEDIRLFQNQKRLWNET